MAASAAGNASDRLIQPVLRVYNLSFHGFSRHIMEAEQLNQIANRLVDIAQRATELRRYL